MQSKNIYKIYIKLQKVVLTKLVSVSAVTWSSTKLNTVKKLSEIGSYNHQMKIDLI